MQSNSHAYKNNKLNKKSRVMNGFNPLSGIKDWHVFLVGAVFGVGVIASIILVVKSIIWVINHVQIN